MTVARSLRLRLSAGAVAVVAIALAVTGLSLSHLFSRHLERRIGQELDTHLAQLIGAVQIEPGGGLALAREPVDPRFRQIFGGLYWQVSDMSAGAEIRSRSLWDTALALPGDAIAPGQQHVHDVEGPQGSTLFVHEQAVTVSAKGREHVLRVAVAVDRAEITALASGFARDLAGVLVVLGLVLILGFWVQVTSGLKPVERVLAGVAAIRTGKARRMDLQSAPAEFAPLIDEVNALIEAQDREMIRARDRAADLAHGLKTPLTALAGDVERLRRRGEEAIAADIDEVAARMRRHIDRELARARLRHGRNLAPLSIRESLAAIIRTLKRTPLGEAIDFQCEIEDGAAARVDAEDLNELLGNVLDNATRHATSRVRVTARREDGGLAVTVGDDGPGLDPDARAAVMARGGRLDTTGGGAGLGLAIVGDILTACGGRMSLSDSVLGGLEVRLWLPADPNRRAAQ